MILFQQRVQEQMKCFDFSPENNDRESRAVNVVRRRRPKVFRILETPPVYNAILCVNVLERITLYKDGRPPGLSLALCPMYICACPVYV